MLIWNGDPTVRNCTFAANSAGGVSLDGRSSWGSGGAISCVGGKPMISECIIAGNWAGVFGGGIHLQLGGGRVLNCVIGGNSSGMGGGMEIFGSDLLVSNCFLTGNMAGNGGGIFSWAGSTLTLTNCVLSANSSSDGATVFNNDSSLTLVNCTLVENSSSPSTVHITETVHTTGGGSGTEPSVLEAVNCIFWNGGSEISNNFGSQLQINYCDIQGGRTSISDPLGGLIWGLGNIDEDPRFVRLGHWESNGTPADTGDDFWVDGDYHLSADSPCIDIGDNTALPPDVHDLDGDGDVTEPLPLDLGNGPRIVNGVVDMGAFETTGLDPVYSLEQLINDVFVLNQQYGIEGSSDTKLDMAWDAIGYVHSNDYSAAANSLQLFIDAVNAQRGTPIPGTEADDLIARAWAIIELLNTQ